MREERDTTLLMDLLAKHVGDIVQLKCRPRFGWARRNLLR